MVSLISKAGVLAEILGPKAGQKILGVSSVLPQRRHLNVQEHVSYTLLNGNCIPTPKFGVAKSGQEAKAIATELNTKNLVLKAQVLAGGRGKGHFKNGLKGGVRLINNPKEAEEITSKMVNQLLVTKQTGAAGRICNSVMVAERKFPRREFYFAVMMERAFNGPVIIASSQGGVNIEEVAAENPDAIIYEPIDISKGLSKEQACKVAEKVGLGEQAEETATMLLNMYDLFVKKDALLIEINPYAEDALEDCKYFFSIAKHYITGIFLKTFCTQNEKLVSILHAKNGIHSPHYTKQKYQNINQNLYLLSYKYLMLINIARYSNSIL
ncbi:SUCLA2 family protein [Megaselia abdita]